MLSIIDVIKGLSDLISSEYPQYTIIDYDIDEGFNRPSFFIEPDGIETSWVANDYIKESSNLKIVFFAIFFA